MGVLSGLARSHFTQRMLNVRDGLSQFALLLGFVSEQPGTQPGEVPELGGLAVLGNHLQCGTGTV